MFMDNVVVVIDDDEYFLSKWKEALEPFFQCLRYTSLSEFEEDLLENKSSVIKESQCVIVDYEFGYTNAGKRDFASYLKNDHKYNKAVILSSLHDNFGEYDKLIRESFDLIIDKTPLTPKELSKLIRSIKTKGV